MSSDYTPPRLVKPTPGGNPGDGSMDGALTVTGEIIISGSSGTVLSTNNASIDAGGRLSLAGFGTISQAGKTTSYNSVGTVGEGLSPIYGLDNRTGVTTADASAKTLYTTTGSGQLYRLMGRILATAGTSPSATYKLIWTEGGTTQTKTLTISALDTDSDLSILIQPDNGTAITAQLTAISGTGTTVNVAATVEAMA